MLLLTLKVVFPPAVCDKTALDEKFDRKTCREWYEHQDGDTMSQNRIRMKNKKRGEIGKRKLYLNRLQSHRFITFAQTKEKKNPTHTEFIISIYTCYISFVIPM